MCISVGIILSVKQTQFVYCKINLIFQIYYKKAMGALQIFLKTVIPISEIGNLQLGQVTRTVTVFVSL